MVAAAAGFCPVASSAVGPVLGSTLNPRCGSEPAQRLLGPPYSSPAKAPVVRLNRCAARSWQVDPFVKGPLGLLVHDFGARTQPPIAVVEFEAVSAPHISNSWDHGSA
jgi:hypothetical protein